MPDNADPAKPEVQAELDIKAPPLPTTATRSEIAELVTRAGRQPAVVVQQPSRAELIFGFVLDLVVVVGLFVLMALKIITATEGLPWVALVVGGKLVALRRRTPPPSNGSATLSLLGV